MASEWDLATELLADAKLLLENGGHRSSVSRSYYAAYHACIALLESLGLKPSNFIGRDRRPAKRWEHGIVIEQVTTNLRMVNLLTKELASPLRWMYSLRLRGDYRFDLSVSSYSAQSSYEMARQMVAKVEEHLT
jgi:uncharacterized protein (UPF0332 family)